MVDYSDKNGMILTVINDKLKTVIISKSTAQGNTCLKACRLLHLEPFLLEVNMPKGVYKHHPHQCFQKGHKTSEETRKKMSESRLGKEPWNKGKKLPQYSGKNSPTWKGGKYINEGYIYILKPKHPFSKKNGYVAEHRLVLEKYLGRYISKIESIHHKNKIRSDNRIKNLMLLKNKSIHNKVDKGIKVDEKFIIYNYQKRRV